MDWHGTFHNDIQEKKAKPFTMKAKLFGTMWKKAANRLNRTREWAASSTSAANYSAFTSVHRAALETDGATSLVRDANNTSDVRALARDSLCSPLVRESAVARLLVEGTVSFLLS